MEGAKKKGILAAVAVLLLFVLIGVGLYLLGGDDQSALEKLRDIAVIFVVLSSIIVVVLLAGVAAALAFLVIQVKDRVIPLLEQATGSAKNITDATKRVKSTTEFVTEEAMKPLMGMVGTMSKARMMRRTVTGKNRKPGKLM